MARAYENWIDSYLKYTSSSEAPEKMRFWTAVSTISGALRRRVGIDQTYFTWWPNMYIILVAKPGIVSKTTTVGVGMDMLRRVPGINFGPDIVTWQALVKHLGEIKECYQLPQGDWADMCALTLESGEFGTLVKPQDTEMIDVLVSLWDGKQVKKATKGSGEDSVANPWVNIIACTTPSWIAGNFPEYMIGGGFVSRCVFVYAEEKAQYVAYPGDIAPNFLQEQRKLLIQDLEHISLKLCGNMVLTVEAKEWGTRWYEDHYSKIGSVEDNRFNGYFARKQTHLHKLAMILSAAKRDSLVITKDDMEEALQRLNEIEEDMPLVFSMIGRSPVSLYTERFINFIRAKGSVEWSAAYRYIHTQFPDVKEFESIVGGALAAGYVKLESQGTQRMFTSTKFVPGSVEAKGILGKTENPLTARLIKGD